MEKAFLIIICFLPGSPLWAQPEPCSVDAMTSTCVEACVVCDIDGFTGRNNLEIQGQTFPGFCTTIFHNMSYIAFIAGTENLTLTVSVTNCTINEGIEVGIFESLDCNNFTAVTACNTDVAPNGTATFSNLVPLVIGQHYYLIMDGSKGDICDWTFNVVEGSTVVGDLTTSGTIEGPQELCSGLSTTYTTEAEVGATLFYWTINGAQQDSRTPTLDFTFPTEGTYDVCVTAANVCDQAPPSCTTINVVNPTPTNLVETLCNGACIAVAGEIVCESGLYEYLVPLPDGCDSSIFLDLIILPALNTLVDLNLCIGETFSIGNSIYNSTGIFVETIPTEMGCDSMVTLNLTMIDCELSGTIDFTTPVCHGDENGTLLFSLFNGTPPFTYDWNNITNPAIAGTGSTNLLADISIENLPAGIYEINIVDNLGNDIVFIQEVMNPPVLTLTTNAEDYNGVNLSCFGAADGTATALAEGGVIPYNFLWNNNETVATITNLAAGNYSVIVTDANGCQLADNIVLTAPSPLEFAANYMNPNCDGLATGIIDLDNISGGTPPFTFALDEGPYGTNSSFQNLSSGTYNYAVLDANGCPADTTSSLFAPAIPIIFPGEDLELDLGCEVLLRATTDDTELTAINWTNFDNSLACDTCLSTYAGPVNDTEYILTIISTDDCPASDTIHVTVNKIRDVYIPNAFSPNGDGTNDSFFINTNKSVALVKNFKIFNRWGAVMFEGIDLPPNQSSAGWDGFYKGALMNPGVYVWVATIEYLDGEISLLSGDITLVL